MYCTCIPVVSINAIGVAGMSLGENVMGTPLTPCTCSVARALRALVTLARDAVLTYGTGTVANDGCRDCDVDRITEYPAGVTCAVVTSGDVTCQAPPLNTIPGPYSRQSVATSCHSHLPSHVVLPRTHSGDLTDSQKINYFVSFCAVSFRDSCIPVEVTPVLPTGFKY